VAEVYIDDAKQAFGAIPGTWGDLLAVLDDRVSAQRLLVTAIRLDGVDEPAFRHPAVASRPLAAVRRIDVETSSPETLFRLCCGDAEADVADIAGRALELASQYRQQDVAAGHRGLVSLADDLWGFLALLQAMMTSPGFEPQWLMVDGATAQEQIATLGDHLEAVVVGQAASDWLTVSDILEYDIEPALRRWQQKLHDVALSGRNG
jgi:hypothetical protein